MQIRGGAHVAAPERAPPGRREMRRRALAETPSMVIERRELLEIVRGLLEVIADNLLVLALALPISIHSLRPVGEALVEVRARTLEEPVVGGIADQDVVEAHRAARYAEGVSPLARNGPNQVLAAQRCKMRFDVRSHELRHE